MIDLRSDTVTQPTDEMRAAMARAEVGDDAREGDPTTRRLESMAAHLLGMDAGLFMPSGTMANLVAVIAHSAEASGVVLEARSHIATVEEGSFTNLARTEFYPVPSEYGIMDSDSVTVAFKKAAARDSRAAVLCLENTHNNAGGTVLPKADMRRIINLGHALGARVHVDGARIFNAAVALGVQAARLVAHADSAMFCISKGLGAPVGSVLCGSQQFIGRARQLRTWCGGALRQSGVLAAAGLVALQDYPERLAQDHLNARRLAQGIAEHPILKTDMRSVQTNMVYVAVARAAFNPVEFERHCYERGVWVRANHERFRFVLHHQVSAADVDHAVGVINSFPMT